jgi:hypothetical protein
MSTTLLRPLAFGELLDGAFSLYRRHFATLFVTALLATAPITLIAATLPADLAAAEAAEAAGGGILLGLLVMIIVMPIAWAALTWIAARGIRDQRAPIGEAFLHGARAYFRLLFAAVLAYMALAAVGTLLLIGGGLGAVYLTPGGEAGFAVVMAIIVGTTFFLMAVVAPSIMFAVPAAIVVEDQGSLAALQRSWRLSRGARVRVLGLVAVSWLIVMLPTLGLSTIGLGAGAYAADATVAASRWWAIIEASVGLLIGALTYPFLACALTLLYFERRVRLEGFDLEIAADRIVTGSGG